MPVSTIVQLLTVFGPSAVNLISNLIAKWENNGVVTSAEWDTLMAELSQNSQSRMIIALKKAGIDPTSAQGIEMLSLAK